MELLALSFKNFRNLESCTLSPSRGATVAVGSNGQGKTNLLEAIFFLVTLKPLRATRLNELVQFGHDTAAVEGVFRIQGADRTIRVEVIEGNRQASVDGKKASSLEDYFGGLAVVAFTPEDLAVMKGGPEARRSFLDRSVFNRFPAYLKEAKIYSRALRSRNRLLKEGAPQAYREVYDDALIRSGTAIWLRRRALLKELSGRAESAFSTIGRLPHPARFGYRLSGLEGDFNALSEADFSESFNQALARRQSRDLARGFTSVGPHSDDLDVRLGDHPARHFASQGQQRALILAWKLAEIENVRATLGFMPLLLLDDVSSELDPERNAYLMATLVERQAQVFLTTTDASLVRSASGPDTLWLQVERGKFTASSALPP